MKGTLTELRAAAFLVSDIEASTLLWESEPLAMLADLAEHDRVMRDAIGTNLKWAFRAAAGPRAGGGARTC